MRLCRKRVTPITLVNNDEIYFILQSGSDGGKISEPVPLDRFITEEIDANPISEPFRRQQNLLMVVPDYWLGNASFPFKSKRKSLAEAFTERKLREQFPEIPGIKDFFGHFFYETDQNETMLYAYFVREHTFFELYERLTQWNLIPRRITTPAFLWASRLRDEITDFQRGGKAFIHNVSSECFLYFFFEGHFLFSRQITLPAVQADPSDQLELLAYETNQSLHLFSQKAKAEIDRVYMSAFGHVDAGGLSERLDREVEEVTGLEQGLMDTSATIGHPGLLSGFCMPDPSRSRRFLSLSHKEVEREQQWKPVQKMGIAVGLILLLLLSGEGLLLWKWSQPVGALAAQGRGRSEREAVRALRQYNEALDLFLKESRRPSASETIINLARALPENVWIKDMEVETEPNPGVLLSCTVRAARPGEFRETLTDLLDNLNNHFEGAGSLGLQDIEFNPENCDTGNGHHTCVIDMKFTLP